MGRSRDSECRRWPLLVRTPLHAAIEQTIVRWSKYSIHRRNPSSPPTTYDHSTTTLCRPRRPHATWEERTGVEPRRSSEDGIGTRAGRGGRPASILRASILAAGWLVAVGLPHGDGGGGICPHQGWFLDGWMVGQMAGCRLVDCQAAKKLGSCFCASMESWRRKTCRLLRG